MKRKTYYYLFAIIFITQSCVSIKGKYCYKDASMGECITFKKNKEFQYGRTIDTGSTKGIGKYTVNKNQLILNFTFPELENRSQIEITKNTDDVIRIKCIDFEGNQVLGRLEIRKDNGFYRGYSLMGQNTELRVSWIEFPATFTFDCLSYQKTSFELLEASGYDIDITLDDNRGFTTVEGQRKYRIISKKKKQLVLEPVADFSDEKVENIRVYKVIE